MAEGSAPILLFELLEPADSGAVYWDELVLLAPPHVMELDL